MGKVFLRALSMSDLELTQKWHSDQDLYSTLGGPFRFVSLEAEREWLQNKVKYSNQELNLMICLSENGQPIGMLSVREIDWISRKGFYSGIIIGDSQHRGKGYGTEAFNLLIRHCFLDLGLNKLYSYILDDNKVSQKMVAKSGFTVEGKLRQHAFKDGKFRDVIIIGLCADQYYKQEEPSD